MEDDGVDCNGDSNVEDKGLVRWTMWGKMVWQWDLRINAD
jgi:hypothetical protein